MMRCKQIPHEPKIHRRLRWWLVATVICAGVAVVVLLKLNLYWGPPLTDEARSVRAAQEALRSSRPGGLDTREFLTFGLRRGMSESEVDSHLPKPVRVLRHLQPEHNASQGYVNVYFFEWGPKQSASSTTPLCAETLYVYFDHQGHAVRIELLRFGHVPLSGRRSWQFELR